MGKLEGQQRAAEGAGGWGELMVAVAVGAMVPGVVFLWYYVSEALYLLSAVAGHAAGRLVGGWVWKTRPAPGEGDDDRRAARKAAAGCAGAAGLCGALAWLIPILRTAGEPIMPPTVPPVGWPAIGAVAAILALAGVMLAAVVPVRDRRARLLDAESAERRVTRQTVLGLLIGAPLGGLAAMWGATVDVMRESLSVAWAAWLACALLLSAALCFAVDAIKTPTPQAGPYESPPPRRPTLPAVLAIAPLRDALLLEGLILSAALMIACLLGLTAWETYAFTPLTVGLLTAGVAGLIWAAQRWMSRRFNSHSNPLAATCSGAGIGLAGMLGLVASPVHISLSMFLASAVAMALGFGVLREAAKSLIRDRSAPTDNDARRRLRRTLHTALWATWPVFAGALFEDRQRTSLAIPMLMIGAAAVWLILAMSRGRSRL